MVGLKFPNPDRHYITASLVFNGNEMIPPRSMSNKSLRGLLWRTQDGTFDGLTCEGEAAQRNRERRLLRDFNDGAKGVNK